MLVTLALGLVDGQALAVDEVTLDDLVITGDDNLVLQWNAAAIQAVRDTAPAPPVVARALAITHTAMFDAWAAYDGEAVGTRLGGSLRRPPPSAPLPTSTRRSATAPTARWPTCSRPGWPTSTP